MNLPLYPCKTHLHSSKTQLKLIIMKKTKILTTIMIALVFISGSVFAQTKEETHTKLTNQHNAIMKNAKAISSGEAKTKDEQVKQANEATKTIDDTKKVFADLKKLIPEKLNMTAKPYYEKMEELYANAITHIQSLNDELKKEVHDNAKVKEYAKKLHEVMEKVEKEHQELMEKIK